MKVLLKVGMFLFSIVVLFGVIGHAQGNRAAQLLQAYEKVSAQISQIEEQLVTLKAQKEQIFGRIGEREVANKEIEKLQKEITELKKPIEEEK